jgi:carbon storage regulator
MLVLTRKLQQEIVIADTIRVTVLEINGNRIRLGIAAPDDIPIHRAEIAPEHSLQACATFSPAMTR